MKPDDFRQRVIAVVARLQPGEVSSYGDVAGEAGPVGHDDSPPR